MPLVPPGGTLAVGAAFRWQERGTASDVGHVPKSPFKVLGVSPHATKQDIKARFRALAKLHHPDVSSDPKAAEILAEIINAYDALLGDDLAGRIQGNQLAYTCEAFTIDELRADGLHVVHALRIIYDCDGSSSSSSSGYASTSTQAAGTGSSAGEPRDTRESGENRLVAAVDVNDVPLLVSASPDDSVLDLKRALIAAHGDQWGLTDRRVDRQGVAGGWELVFGGSALSYHLFLHDYEIGHGDVVHAVVRRAD